MAEERTDFYRECRLCPRNCGTDRRTGTGFCGLSNVMRAARAGLHYYEEPYISGINGSGTVFFTGCSLGCIYCQNSRISKERFGIEISVKRLAQIFLEQQERKAHNINIVTGTHFTPSIAEAIRLAKTAGLVIPVIWNSSGYEKPEVLSVLDGLVDIFMPDLKTLSGELSFRYMHARDYPEHAIRAIDKMVRMTGKAQFSVPADRKAGFADISADEIDQGSGILMKKGVLVRHLVIPGHTKDSMNVLTYLHETYGDEIWISLMSQYTPSGIFAQGGQKEEREGYPELCRTLTRREYDKVVDFAITLGIKNCMIQDCTTAVDSFIPEFDGTGIFPCP